MPRIIPVLDVMAGRAVRAVGGRRHDYRPLASTLRPGSDPVALAAAVRDAFNLRELYLADLDAIAGAPAAIGLFSALDDLGLATWIDAGTRDPSSLAPLLKAGIARVVIGLETLADPADLKRLVEIAGPDRLVFSLDLRGGEPIVPPGSRWETDDPRRISERVIAAGFRSVIVLDVSHVGMGRGVGPLDLLATLARDHPQVEWVTGGGARDRTDVEGATRLGASAVLVGSALHDGRIATVGQYRIS